MTNKKELSLYDEISLAIDSIKEDLEILEIIKKNAKFSGRLAKECDKDGNLVGVFSILEVILTGKNAEIIERWLER